MDKIILLGYMGSGKTQTAQALSRAIGWPVLDLDDVIQRHTQMTIAQIFETQGEIKFRKLEHELLNGLMQDQKKAIISLGGGTPCYANNHEWLTKPGVVSVYLKTAIDTLFDRLWPERHHRPLIAQLDEAEMKEFIAKSLFERSFYYNHATHKIDTDGLSVDQVVSKIKEILV